MCPSRIDVGLPGPFRDDVTVRLGAYTAQAELENASAANIAPATRARRVNLFMKLSFPRS
jgi:hypothetical protein